MNTAILIITTLFSGLMAGLFYAWSISVTPGLAKIDNTSYLKAFQSMNRAILNPVFFLAFFGLAVLLIYMSFKTFGSPQTSQQWMILSAAVLYLGGIMFVTIFGNIPLNNSLESLQIETMTPAQMTAFRETFESKWNRLNMIRTICSSLSFLLLITTCIQNSN